MNGIRSSLLGLLVTLLSLSSMGTLATAQDFVLDVSTFDSWLLSSTGGYVGNNPRGIEGVLKDEAKMKIALLEMSCKLTEEQRLRLELAALDDSTDFIVKVNTLKKELVGKTFPQNDISVPYQRIQELGIELQGGLYGEKSLFRKVFRSVLTPEQLEAAEKAEKERRQRRHEASIGMLITGLEQFTPMTATQRDELRKLLLEHSKPATRSSQYDRYMLLYQISTVPEEKLKAVLDEAQWKSLAPALRNGQAYKQMLEMQGLLEDE